MAFGGSAMMAVLVLTGLLHSAAAAATIYRVGENVGGWTLPPDSTANVFDQQFSSITLLPGDILLFPFTSGQHNVYEVSPSDLAACSGANPINTYTTTNSTVTLSKAGTYAFICDIPTHCDSGMHLQVTVASTIPSPAPTPKSSTPSRTPTTFAPAPTPKSSTPSSTSTTFAPAPTPTPKSSTPSPAPTTFAPAPTPKSSTPSRTPTTFAPAPTPKSSTPSRTPTTFAPAPTPKSSTPISTRTNSASAPRSFNGASGVTAPGLSNGASALVSFSAPAIMMGSLLMGCAFLLL